MMANSTLPSLTELPPLPEYTLELVPPLVPPIPDKYFLLLAPLIGYWVMSGFFHILDTYDLCAKYRLHTPVELLRRNRVSKKDVLRDVIIQQVVQTIFGVVIGYFEVENVTGREEHDIAVWATRVRLMERAVPSVLAIFGLNATQLSETVLAKGYTSVAGVLAGGQYAGLSQQVLVDGKLTNVPAFAFWELLVARSIFWLVIPALQFLAGIIIVDTWQYFLHRAMHMNKYLYTTLHSRHHRLYVPYAYGALYNHPIEGFLLDTLGAGAAYMVTGMTARQGMWFFGGSSVKTVDDHCGYALPWDPLQHLTSNNAAYHDIHHQSWGIKTNFSQPFFTFWDRILDTKWTGGDVETRYARDRANAQRLEDKDAAKVAEAAENIAATSCEIVEEEADYTGMAEVSSRTRTHQTRRSTGSGGLKVIRERVDGRLRGRGRDATKSESSSSHPIAAAIS
jgi:sphinganine C4-monooxygenase